MTSRFSSGRWVVLGCLVALLLAVGVPSASAETLTMPKRDGLVGTPLVVWGVTTQANGTAYTMDFGDGAPVTGTVTDRSYIAFTHTYAASGEYTATLTVGTESASVKIRIFDPANPAELPGGVTGDAYRGLRINMAIEDGLRYLWTAQSNRAGNFPAGTDTLWTGGSGFYTSHTALVTLAFQNHGYTLPNDNSAPTGVYEKYVVQRGLNYVISGLSTIALSAQAAGNPCAGVGSDCVGLAEMRHDTFHQSYTTGVAILPIAASGALNRTATVGTYTNGKTYGEILQRLTNTIVFGQIDAGTSRGGWYYNFNSSSSDGSTVGWDLLSLLDAEAAGAVVPAFAKTQFANALTAGLNADGSFDYQADGNANSYYYPGMAKGGIPLQGLYFIGETSGARVDLVKNYISARWTSGPIGSDYSGWGCTPYLGQVNRGCAYSMFNAFKGLKLQGITTLPGVARPAGPGSQPAGDWYADYQDWLVANQTLPNSVGGGSWSGMQFSCCDSGNPINAAIAELILSPVALVLPDATKFSTVGLTPPTATSIEGGSHTVTAKAESTGGTPIGGATVTFKVISGPNAGVTGTSTTGADGKANFTYTDAGPDGTTGTDKIQAFIGTLSSNVVEMIWTPKNQAPVAQCQDITVAANATCQGSGSVNNGSFDPDAGDTITMDQSPAGPYSLGTNNVMLTVTDDHGASVQCTAVVTVVDQTPPAITCGPDQVVECTGNSSAPASVSASATDNCDANVNVSCPAAGSYPLGTTTVTCTATDAAGNSSSCQPKVTVRDTTPPTITCPAAIVAECTGNNSAPVTPGTAAASDVCGAVTVAGPAAGSYPLGTTMVSYTATDAVGLPASCSAPITVRDTTPPVVTCVESFNPSGKNIPKATSDRRGEENEDGYFKVGATDVCAAPSAVSLTLGSFTLASGETIKVTQTPGRSGVRLVREDDDDRRGNTIRHFLVGPGDAVVVAIDPSGNRSSVTCPVPPRHDKDEKDKHEKDKDEKGKGKGKDDDKKSAKK